MNLKESAVKSVRNALKASLADLEALPEDVIFRSFGEKVRTVADIMQEVIMVNDHIGLSMRGEPAFEWPEGWVKASPELNTKAKVMEALRAVTEREIAYGETLSDEQFEEPMETEHGTTNRYERFRFMAMHMMYHSGQLNFIQTMLGDDGWHW